MKSTCTSSSVLPGVSAVVLLRILYWRFSFIHCLHWSCFLWAVSNHCAPWSHLNSCSNTAATGHCPVKWPLTGDSWVQYTLTIVDGSGLITSNHGIKLKNKRETKWDGARGTHPVLLFYGWHGISAGWDLGMNTATMLTPVRRGRKGNVIQQ